MSFQPIVGFFSLNQSKTPLLSTFFNRIQNILSRNWHCQRFLLTRVGRKKFKENNLLKTSRTKWINGSDTIGYHKQNFCDIMNHIGFFTLSKKEKKESKKRQDNRITSRSRKPRRHEYLQNVTIHICYIFVNFHLSSWKTSWNGRRKALFNLFLLRRNVIVIVIIFALLSLSLSFLGKTFNLFPFPRLSFWGCGVSNSNWDLLAY